MVKVILYGKAGCHLCDEAREHLERVAAERELDLREVDIRTDPILFERYRYRIPVIEVEGEERLEGRITEQDVRDLLLADA
jgi:glutaredoxin